MSKDMQWFIHFLKHLMIIHLAAWLICELHGGDYILNLTTTAIWYFCGQLANHNIKNRKVK